MLSAHLPRNLPERALRGNFHCGETLLLLLVLSAALSPAAGAQTGSAQESKSLADLAREARGDKPVKNPCPPATPCDASLSLSKMSPS